MKRALTIAALAAALSACGGGGSGDDDASNRSWASVFLQDAPAEDLDTFVLTITQVTLVAADGSQVVLFSGSMTEDLLDLVMIQELIASASIPPGSYSGLLLAVESISATANGVAQTITGVTLPATLEVQFEEPVAFLPGSTATISLDFDVEDSVEDGGGDTIVVSPVIFADVESKHIDLNDFEGIVQSVGDGVFVVQVIESSGPGSAEPVGLLTVQWADASDLAPGMEVEVEGEFENGVVIASEVEIEDESDSELEGVVTSLSGSTAVVNGVTVQAGSIGVMLGEKVEVVNGVIVQRDKTRYSGTISAIGANSLTLSPLTAERQVSLASRTFSVNAQTVISIDDVILIGLSDLSVGQTVKVKALALNALEIEREGDEIEGFRSQVSSIGANSFVLNGTTVEWSSATELVIVTGNESADLAPADFNAALEALAGSAKVKVEGVLNGSTMTATEIVLQP